MLPVHGVGLGLIDHFIGLGDFDQHAGQLILDKLVGSHRPVKHLPFDGKISGCLITGYGSSKGPAGHAVTGMIQTLKNRL